MRKIIVQEFLTIDGVMQAPGTKEEDIRGNFTDGGWQLPYYEESLVQFMIDQYKSADALLLGSRTYKTFADYWPNAPDDGNPFIPEMNRLVKYVVSHNQVDMPWNNSVQITGDVVEKIQKLKAKSGKNILVLGSGELVQTLMQYSLVDEFNLIVAPIKLGKGVRLFREGELKQELNLISSLATSKGELILRYKVKY